MGSDEGGPATERWGSGLTRSSCQPVLQGIPRVICIQSPCLSFALCIVHVSTSTTCNTIDADKARRQSSPLCAHILPLPVRALHARMPCTCLHVPCPCLYVRFVCACLPCLFSLHTVDVGILLQSDIPLARVFEGAPMHRREYPAELATVMASFSR